MHIFLLIAAGIALAFAHPSSSSPPNATIAIADCVDCGCGDSVDCTVPAVNPDLHQAYLHKQLSEVNDCKSGSCGVGKEQSTSFTIEWSATAHLGVWIDAGFAVSESWETGNQYTCDAEGESVCIWQKIAHTKYTVGGGTHDVCGKTCDTSNGPVVVTSPNKNNAGGKYYYVRKHKCFEVGHEWWEDGPAGGRPA